MPVTKFDVLNEHGFATAGIATPSARRRAVENFQRAWAFYPAQLLEVDGVLGPKTTRAMQFLPMLSPHFSVWEMWDGRAHECCIRRELLVALERLRKHIGKPLVIASGYRTLSTNTLLNGAAHSLHLHGLAADIATDVPMAAVRDTAAFSGIGVRWVGQRAKARHVDVRHVLGADSPTPGASVSRPARWSYR